MNRLILTHQRGSSLVFSLVILTAITLGAIVAMQRSTLQLRMIGNMQHQQSLFNATVSDFSNVMTSMQESPVTARSILGELINLENNSIAQGNSLGRIQINPYRFNGIHVAPKNSGVNSTTHSMQLRNMPSDTPNSLKQNAGSSAGTLVPYHFTSTVQAADTNNNTRENHEYGFYYMAPSSQQ